MVDPESNPLPTLFQYIHMYQTLSLTHEKMEATDYQQDQRDKYLGFLFLFLG